MSRTSTLPEQPGVEPALQPPPASRHQPKITSVVPVVRQAKLVRHVPHLDEGQAMAAATLMQNAWPSWRETYRLAVAQRANLRPQDVWVDEREVVRLRKDGKTPMVDFPRVQTTGGAARPFDVRICAALCIDDYSSKFWTRVGPPFGSQRREYEVHDLESVLARYRWLAQSCSAWFHDEFLRLAGGAFSGCEEKDEGALEVTTVGLHVEEEITDEELHEWLFRGDDKPNFDNDELCSYIKRAASLGYHARELGEREPDSFWMSIPMAVQLENGDLASRTALYLVRAVENLVQIVGVGLDDSRNGEFASDVALKVSRFVANRV